MSQSLEDIRRVAGILGQSLDSTVVHEEFGQVMVRLEAREVNDSQLQALQSFAAEVGSRPVNGSAPAKVFFDALTKRIFYSVPERDGDGALVGSDALRSELKHAGIKVLNSR